MRGLPKKFSRNYLIEMAANLVKSRLYVLIFKRCFVAEMFSALSAVFLFGWAFVCLVLSGLFIVLALAVHYFAASLFCV